MRPLCTIILFIPVIHASAQKQSLFYSSGSLQYSYEIKNDKLDGIFLSYYPNSSIKVKGSFIAGQKSGLWQAWDTAGVLRTKRYFASNSEFELLDEWTSDGKPIEDIAAKRDRLQNDYYNLHTQDSAFGHTYWREILPESPIKELFTTDFFEALKTKINTGQIKVRLNNEPRYRVVSLSDTGNIPNRLPDKYIQVEDHFYSTNCQKAFIDAFNILIYKEPSGEKMVWLLIDDFESFLNNSFPLIRYKLDSYLFSTKANIVDFSTGYMNFVRTDPAKTISVMLSEIDREVWIWIYSINKGEPKYYREVQMKYR